MGIGLAIPTYEREEMTVDAFIGVYNDPYLDEIVIVDDASASIQGLLTRTASLPKVHVFRNATNLGCYRNKREAMVRATAEWVVLFDSDNVMPVEYLDALWQARIWNPETLYLPVWGHEKLNYRIYEGLQVTQYNVANFLDDPIFQMALNTGNFFVHRASYLDVRQHDDREDDPLAADSLQFVSRWLASGRRVLFTPGLWYDHRVHDGLWMQHAVQSEVIARTIITHMKALWPSSC